MQEDKEKALQQLLDADKSLKHAPVIDDQEDFNAYQLLYSALKEEPAESLSYGFKIGVLKRIQVEKRGASDFKLYLFVGLTVIIGLVFIAFLAYSYSTLLIRYADVVKKILGFICISLFSLSIFHFVEKKYLKV